MREDKLDNPNCWNRSSWEADQQKLKNLEKRVKDYLLDIDVRYKVNILYNESKQCVG